MSSDLKVYHSLSTITFNDAPKEGLKKSVMTTVSGRNYIGDGAETTWLVEFSIGYQQTLTELGQNLGKPQNRMRIAPPESARLTAARSLGHRTDFISSTMASVSSLGKRLPACRGVEMSEFALLHISPRTIYRVCVRTSSTAPPHLTVIATLQPFGSSKWFS